MSHNNRDFDALLARRLELASKPENMGDDLVASDYLLLGLVTVVVPALLMIAGWAL